jgi:uncharacterized protein with PIN domain
MVFKILVASFLAITLIIMIISTLKGIKNDKKVIRPAQPEESYRNCPLCGTALVKGETVHSHLFPGKPDGMMNIYGCPYCYKEHPRAKERAGLKRICPYCKKTLSKDGWVVARVFEKPEKTHIHVLGCTECRKVR